MADQTEVEKKISEELSIEATAAQMLYLLGETLLLEIDEKAEIQYEEAQEPHHFVFAMSNGRKIAVFVTEIKA